MTSDNGNITAAAFGASQSVTVRHATPTEAELVGRLAHDLLAELYPDYARQFGIAGFIAKAATALALRDRFWAFLAEDAGTPVGLITLNECCSIYAGGAFGEIPEFYIAPHWRGRALGARMIDEVKTFGRARGWRNIEVGAPDRENWSRSIAFYKRLGFVEVGPRLDLTL
jgi:GNAT superfamily N-acetyltransferase